MITSMLLWLLSKKSLNRASGAGRGEGGEQRESQPLQSSLLMCPFSGEPFNCDTISLSRHEQVCLMRLRFERYFSHDGRSISRNIASLNILVHDVINLLYYEHWTDKRKYFYVYGWNCKILWWWICILMKERKIFKCKFNIKISKIT